MSTTKEECQREYDIAQKRACDAEAENARLRDALGEFAKPGHWLEDDYDGHWEWNGEQNDPHFFAQEALKEI